MVQVKVNQYEWYMDTLLTRKLDKIKAKVRKNQDHVIVIDGKVGKGKSTLAVQIARYCDPSFCVDRVCFNPEDFMDKSLAAEKYQCIILDEAYRSWASIRALSEMTFKLNAMMMEIRQKNLIFILVLPSFFDLNKTIALFRADTLLHVTDRKPGSLGGFWYYDDRTKKYLYIMGKKFYDYSKAHPLFRGTFNPSMPFDEEKYLAKKSLVLKELKTSGPVLSSRQQKTEMHRNVLIRFLKEERGLNFKEIAEILSKESGFVISSSWVGRIYRKFSETTSDARRKENSRRREGAAA